MSEGIAMDKYTVVLRCSSLSGVARKVISLGFTGLAAVIMTLAPLDARADEDLPGRVGRIADYAGQLYLSPEDRATEWASVGLNYPVTSGDNLWVSGDGRAEVDYGGGQFRLAGDTNLHISRLDEAQLSLFIAQGRIVVRVRVLDPGDAARIDTANTQIQLTRPGLYRVDVTPDRQTTMVTVREGEATVALVAGAQQALPGQTVIVTGPEPTVADIRNGSGQDGFDTWSSNRDRRYERSRATAYVSRQMVGYTDLDEYGTWQSSPDYGAVWYPTAVADGWVPYRDGYWTHVGGWGYTWVDNAPWGYAPFHYGRWAYVGGRWGWCPGAYAVRPAWAPALVGWHGGAGWGVAMGLGAPVYGWVPLAWGEAYHPGWRGCSSNCWARYNRPYAVVIAARSNALPPRYANIGVPGAMTVVAGATLAGRLPVGNNLVRVPGQQTSAAPVLAGAPAVAVGPLHGPKVRPGTGGAPVPASTFYATSRSARTGGTLLARPPMPADGAGSGTAAGTPTSPASAAVPLAPRIAPSPAAGAPGAGGRPPTAGTVPLANSAAVAHPASSGGSVAAGAEVPVRGAGSAGTPAPGSAEGVEGRPRRRAQPAQPSGILLPPTASQQVSGGIPIPPAAFTRSAPARNAPSDGGVPLPAQASRGTSDARNAGLHAPVAAPRGVAPGVARGPTPGATGPAPQHGGGHPVQTPAAVPGNGQNTAKAAAVAPATPGNNSGSATVK
jgi:uncharacterized protein DUF6600